MLKAIDQAGRVMTLNRNTHARHITGSVIGIMTDFKRLAKAAKNNLLLCKYARQAYAMYAEPLCRRRASPQWFLFLRVALAQLLAHLGYQLRCFDRRS